MNGIDLTPFVIPRQADNSSVVLVRDGVPVTAWEIW
jgi:hypothetical protein